MTKCWTPTASLAALQARALMYQQIRQFFAERQVLEVETPLLAQAPVSDPNIEPMATADGRYLHTSPEYAMKRLLCAGSGDIYQICKVFRRGEAGRRHNPEFSMLEWYRLDWNEHQLMDEVADIAVLMLGLPSTPPRVMLTYQQALLQYAGLDPLQCRDVTIAECGQQLAGQDLSLDRDGWLDVIMSHAVEPALPRDTLVFVYDFPASQAALAKTRRTVDGHDVAERFELFWNGAELANGYHELTDVAEQTRRFEQEANGRPIDKRLLAALGSGLPPCAGVAMGLDRLLMQRLQVSTIAEVLSFDWLQA
ncbi:MULTISPECIES: EF-P lysine aminoacylase EpmA [unclassified Oceanobacter]|jgi:lysyl-tRNA synthetase class 2|uniref:EF-P lysine aminoacylase EpmA n=1 Tax=unclassified Oceanobacter TaxID=2620260 RepID=UPI002732A481|nr:MULTISPECIES: EF-P lysine aminoacylase EpmA [unclassified Oceanobacter]MDP2547586.1 EF-P lysine aminoacylase EpmA [Oceanobacter sp. 4_MG-2023]MDP2608959.1 EF-P lysine aminoacylase EpmA [Oceanobacter sp. 1_MG-2023]MDP2612056.1 EF-P lysine aminoacylase EpmA [Oceanobacter sp. 2_MG-2023]